MSRLKSVHRIKPTVTSTSRLISGRSSTALRMYIIAFVAFLFFAIRLGNELNIVKTFVQSSAFFEVPLPHNFGASRSDDFERGSIATSSHISQRQIATSQDISRQNVSRSLCGAIPKTSPRATRFPRILSSSPAKLCSSNAILYMVQKGKHSSYKRDSSALFQRSLDQLYQNYLSINQHSKNVDLLIVHTGDYTQEDLDDLDCRFNHSVHVKLIDLKNTDYWTMPETVRNDNISKWGAYPDFSVGYRHMIRWYGLKLYDFARDYADTTDGCHYNYLMRMDEDSFLHSPITYDLFDFMRSNNYSYGYRMCSYEMEMGVWDEYVDHHQHCGGALPSGVPHRRLEEGLCGFYNNFFIIETKFTLQPGVQNFLQWIDALGIMYRERYNDLQIQTIAVYAFMPPDRIHRFLDWTYEHVTVSRRCPVVGAIQAGYLDPDPKRSFAPFVKDFKTCGLLRDKGLGELAVSLTYAHLPPSSWWEDKFGIPRRRFRWKTLGVGSVEDPRVRWPLSG